MNPLLPVLVACLLSELGGRTQANAHALGMSGTPPATMTAVLLTSSFLHYGIAAIGGELVRDYMPANARDLLYGLALIFAGLPLLLPRKAIVPPATSPSAIKAFGKVVVAQFGDAAAFIVFAASARTGEPILSAFGAVLAMMLVGMVPVLAGKDWPGRFPVRTVRIMAAVLLTLFGAQAALTALAII
jgi:Ca2+/H+ antiporter, TMEM165/GDT1 family